jgi:hypothetical protein
MYQIYERIYCQSVKLNAEEPNLNSHLQKEGQILSYGQDQIISDSLDGLYVLNSVNKDNISAYSVITNPTLEMPTYLEFTSYINISW